MHISKPALYTDFYELTMAQGYFNAGKKDRRVTFDYFFRSIPFNGGYVIFAGLGDFLTALENFSFQEDELEYLAAKDFSPEFIDYLRDFRFSGTIYSAREGEVIFPGEPIMVIEANIIEAQLIETLLLNLVNFESLIATKTSRIVKAAGKGKPVMDFGMRRAQGTGAMQATKAAVIGGAVSTSNVAAGYAYNLDVSGTMAHSWIQFFEDELTAFRTYARHYPNSTTLLVDTYNTLESGLPNAIKTAREMEQNGHKLFAVRLDSGDLAFLAKQTRKILNEAGLDYVKIVVSNQLDEHLIKSLNEQKAPIDIFGVGTKLVTAYDEPALDGVYKLSAVNGTPVLKISDNITKTTLPARKKVIRYYNEDGTFNCDGVVLADENSIDRIYHPHQPIAAKNVSGLSGKALLKLTVQNGRAVAQIPTAHQSAQYARERLKNLNNEHKRFDFPHVYKVGISQKLLDLRNHLLTQHS